MGKATVLFLCCVLGVTGPLSAQSNLVPPPMPPAQAEIYARVTSRVLAPCCWSQPVQIHQSEAAEKVRAEVLTFIRQGYDDREIFDSLAAEYGERILGEPRGMRGTVAYVTPFVILGLGLAGLWIALLRISRRRPQLSFYDEGSLPDLPDEL
jgi:cytochrome c-type biogenesis protein CcmH/NrfF